MNPRTSLTLAGVLALVAFAPRPAAADRFRLGVSVGRMSYDAASDSHDTRGVFARVRVSGRLSAEVDAERRDDANLDVHRLAGLAIYELSKPGTFTPYLIGGLAIAHADSVGSYTYDVHDKELGLGLDWRVDKNLVIGADVRAGDRAVVDGSLQFTGSPPPYIDYFPYQESGRYTTIKVAVGVTF